MMICVHAENVCFVCVDFDVFLSKKFNMTGELHYQITCYQNRNVTANLSSAEVAKTWPKFYFILFLKGQMWFPPPSQPLPFPLDPLMVHVQTQVNNKKT